MKKTLLIAIIVFLSIPVFAQITQEKRIELELEDAFYREDVIPFKEHGFLLEALDNKKVDGARGTKYDLYNTNLEKVKTESVSIPKKQSLSEEYRGEHRLHSLYVDGKGNYTLTTVDAKDLKINRVQGIFPKKARINDMVILNEKAFVIASIKKEFMLFNIDWKTGKSKLVPLDLPLKKARAVSLINLQLLEESTEVVAAIKVVVNKSTSHVYLTRFEESGKKKGTSKFTEGIDKQIISISTSKVGNEYIYTGTFSEKSRLISQGLFFGKGSGDKVAFVNYYKFTEFRQFLDFLPEKKKKKFEKKKQRKEKRGKELIINYRIASHNIMKVDGGYRFLGEAYYPTYRTEYDYQTQIVNGVSRQVRVSRRVFNGYKYTHAILTKFNDNGDLEWDRCFEMYPCSKPMRVRKFISIPEMDQSSIRMLMASCGAIYSKSYDANGEILNDKKIEELTLKNEGDESRWTTSNLHHWYGEYFISFGKQKIKNKEDDKVKKKRRVFYVNKVKYE